MISYFVRYRGATADPAGFIHHAAILKEFAGIRTLSLHEAVDWTARTSADFPNFQVR